MIILWLYELCSWIWPLIKVWQGRETTGKHLAKIFLCLINQPQFIHSCLKGHVFSSSKLPSPRLSLSPLRLGWVNSDAQHRARWRQHCICPVSYTAFSASHRDFCQSLYWVRYISLISVTLRVLIAWRNWSVESSGSVQLLIPCTGTDCISSTFLSQFFHVVETILTVCTLYGKCAEGYGHHLTLEDGGLPGWSTSKSSLCCHLW